MKKVFVLILGALSWVQALSVYAVEKFDILPDLPEPLAAAQASSVSTTSDTVNVLGQQSIGHEPNIISLIFSLIFVILLIYATGIIYTKLNKLGFNTLKKQIGESVNSKVAVVSTTPLGSNKTLHVVELDGKRMLIGASQSSIHLIKDLGSYPPIETDGLEYSKIEIPNIRIPKIEIPKIEFPNLGFTKATPKTKTNEEANADQNKSDSSSDDFEISEIYEEGPDGIIDKLFHTSSDDMQIENNNVSNQADEHKVDPDEFALYKKYL